MRARMVSLCRLQHQEPTSHEVGMRTRMMQSAGAGYDEISRAIMGPVEGGRMDKTQIRSFWDEKTGRTHTASGP